MLSQIEKYAKALENQNLNDFLLETLVWINFAGKNWLSFQKYDVSEKLVVCKFLLLSSLWICNKSGGSEKKWSLEWTITDSDFNFGNGLSAAAQVWIIA